MFPFGGLIVGILTLIFGIVVLIWPKLLAYLIGIYLIIIGVVQIIASLRA